jgi:uncharacterized protein (TIGR00369 family)
MTETTETTTFAAGFGAAKEKTISWHSPSEVLPQVAQLTGIEYLRGVRDGVIPPPPMGALTIHELPVVEDGEIVLRSRPDESFLNTMGLVHGGFLCTLLDSAIGMAVITKLPAGAAFATVELKVSFMRPLPYDGSPVEVRGRVLQLGRKIAFGEAHAFLADGRLAGHATSSLAAIA